MLPLKDDIPSRSVPVVTVGLIAMNLLAFMYQFSLSGEGPGGGGRAAQELVLEFGLIPCRLTGQCRDALGMPSPFVTVFTSMFLHGGLFHVGGNMLYLWIFGNNVEDTLGHGRFLAFYLLSGVAPALAQTLTGPGPTVPRTGATGARAGVLGPGRRRGRRLVRPYRRLPGRDGAALRDASARGLPLAVVSRPRGLSAILADAALRAREKPQ